jgi:hypothetical protein
MKTQILRMLIPTMIGGELAIVDDLVEVTVREANDLITRGRAMLHDIDDTAGGADATVVGSKEAAKTGRKAKA